MLAVVLFPIVIMVVACLLERFEARAVPADPPRAITRPTRPSAAPVAASPVADSTPVRHLALVPDPAPEQADDRTLPRAS